MVGKSKMVCDLTRKTVKSKKDGVFFFTLLVIIGLEMLTRLVDWFLLLGYMLCVSMSNSCFLTCWERKG